VTDFVELTVLGFLHVSLFFSFGLFELFEVTLVISKLLILEVDNFIASSIQEIASVRHNQDCCLS
jgi:hypothetical protein